MLEGFEITLSYYSKTWASKKVGCRHPWDSVSDSLLPMCKSAEDLNRLHDYLNKFSSKGMKKIQELSGCKRNCRFRNFYKFHEQQMTDKEMDDRNEIWLNIILSKSMLKIKTETLMFPLRSLIADLGGTLGLFLGFSFVMIWDGFEAMIIFSKHHYAK